MLGLVEGALYFFTLAGPAGHSGYASTDPVKFMTLGTLVLE
jgi:hypothetical protein